MKIDQIKIFAKSHGIKSVKATKSELIRLIQHAEGNQECFNTGQSKACGQFTCSWREDCH